jgi:hypothetical protein
MAEFYLLPSVLCSGSVKRCMPAAHNNTLWMHTPLTFAEILSALSHALDITEGQPRAPVQMWYNRLTAI